MVKQIYIFDIDGCVMPPIISNFNDSNELREKIVNKVANNGNGIKVFPEFVRFYGKYCKQAKSVFFITGRKYNEFGKLTESQLKLLEKIKMFQVRYYPEEKQHKSNEYFEWKINAIKEIVNCDMNKKFRVKYLENGSIFNIFDDMNTYFTEIKELSEKIGIKVQLFLISGDKSWNSLQH